MIGFIALSLETDEIVGYYTLAAASIALASLPLKIARKLPRYPVIAAALLGRLAMARSHRRQGLGGVLLADAIKRVGRRSTSPG